MRINIFFSLFSIGATRSVTNLYKSLLGGILVKLWKRLRMVKQIYKEKSFPFISIQTNYNFILTRQTQILFFIKNMNAHIKNAYI